MIIWIYLSPGVALFVFLLLLTNWLESLEHWR